MRELRIKNGVITLDEQHETYLDTIKEFTEIDSFDEMTLEDFNSAIDLEMLFYTSLTTKHCDAMGFF